jgi:filamentous hemagglutinin
MNQGIYKLVYSKVLNMLVPASEAASSCGSKGSKRIRKHAKNLLCFMLIGNLIYAGSVWADPVGLVPGTQAWINATITGATNNSITITQTAPKAILDWQKLNLNVGELLKFNQQGNRTWSALNRIHDLSPSILDGTVLADGNVYFINTNGIIFGKNAQFNVGSLYAGTLDITNDLFNSGFVNDTTFTNVFGDGITGIGGFVTVENGAQINAASGGKVLLFAPTVTNNGVINTPDGQTILAAGNKVYLQSSKDPAGFLVEVDSGGTATNLGKIVAERGNITMMGLAVNQAGTLTATTSVRANGSIRLLAQDKAVQSGVDVIGARNGIVTLAKGSVTEVTPEYANKEETIASQPFKTSDVKIEASLVNIDGTISAKGGNVTVSALNPASAELVSQNPNGLVSRIYLGDNAVIDVSGVDAVAPMSRNQLEIQLFSDQLKDAPILRDSGLFKDTVYVDARKGTQLFDIAPFLALKGATVAEKMTKAGTITLSTPNDLITEKGSVLNVSGGSTTYEAGAIRETNLYYNGKLVPISEAKPGIPYDKTADVYTVKDSKWGVTRSWDLSGGGTQGWGDVITGSANSQLKTTIVGSQVAGYFEGDDAGILDLTVHDDKVATQNLVLAGKVLANTKVSTQQLINQTIPKGGEFVASANDLLIAKNANDLVAGFNFNQKLDDNFQSSVGTDLFAQGFNDVDLTKTTKVEVNDAIQLKPNGKLILGGSANINADIIAPSSDIKLGVLPNSVTTVADGVKISTAGSFINDKPGIAGQYSQPVAINGGTINASILTLGKDATLDASAGASVDNKGVLHEGEAGNIKFTTTSKIDDSVTLQAYGFKQGGKLDVAYGLAGQEKTVSIGGNLNASATDIDVSNDFFNKGGFSNYSISGFDVNIGDNSAAPQEVYATAQTWRMNANFANEAGGQPIASVASPFVQPDSARSPVSLSISADKLGGVLTLAENATIRTDRGGSVSLAAGKQVNVLGDIVTPSGTINIKINDKDGSLLYDPTQAIFIGAKANLSATGSSLSLPDSQPKLLKAQVFNAGNITIDAPKGALVIKEGAVLDVSGTSIVNDTKTVAGFTRETLHGDAGIIKLSASDGLLLDGTFKGAATGTGRGGTLDVGFTSTRLDAGAPILTGNREFTITQQKQLVAQNFAAGDALRTATGDVYNESSADTIRAGISADQVKQGGFANLKVKSFAGDSSLGLKDSIQLENGLDLQLAGNLKLETPQINVKNDGSAKLTASHITLKSPNSSVDNASIAAGEGKLITQSKQLYIDGLMAIAGVKETSINTTQDISGQGTQIAKDGLPAIAGGLVANGDINLKARQIYPNTAAKLSFEAVQTALLTCYQAGLQPSQCFQLVEL